MNRRSLVGLVGVIISLLLLSAATGEVRAADCLTGPNESEAITTPTDLPQAYRWYVRSAEGDARAPGGLGEAIEIRQTNGGACYRIEPDVAPSGQHDTWRPAHVVGEAPLPAFFKNNLFWNNVGNAAIGAVMIVSDDTGCLPTSAMQCRTALGDATMLYTPRMVGSEGDALSVSVVDSSVSKKIRQVVTYIDHKEAYRRPVLAPTDTRYMRAGVHDVETHILYTDGNKAVYTTKLNNKSEDLTTYYFVYIVPNLRTLAAIGVGLGIFVLCVVVLAVVRRLYRRHLWLKEHNLT